MKTCTLGTARLANFRLGYTAAMAQAAATRVSITLKGVEVRTRVAGLTIRDVLNDAPNSCTLTIDGPAPQCEQALRVSIGDRLLFNGALQTVDATYEGRPENQAFPCSAIDDTARANRMRPFGSWVNVSATTFARDLITRFAPGFTTVHVQAALPTVTIILDGTEGMSGALAQAASQIGGYFYFEDSDLHFFITEATEPPDTIDGSPGTLLDEPPISVVRDDSQLRTRQCGRAHSEQLLADVLGAETLLPVENAGAWFGTVTPGGRAIALSQRLAYNGVLIPTVGALVGPGAGPTTAPTVAAVAGTGLGSGVYKYAYTDVTAAGESLAGPVATVTAGSVSGGLLADPVSAPTATLSTTVGGVPVGGPYTYRVSFTNAAGETLAGPSSAAVYVNVIVNNIPVWTSVTVQAGGSIPQGVLNYRYVISLLDSAGNETEMAGNNLNCGQPSSGGGSFLLTGIGVSGDPRVVTKRLYRTNNDGASWQFIAELTNGATSYTDTAASATGIPLRMFNTTGRAIITLASVPTGPTGTTGRNIYRTDGSGSTGLAATINNNSATTVNDSNATPTGPLPSANTTGTTTALNQITVSGLALGAPGTTSRRLYRTAANGTQLKLLATIANNTATSYGIDVAADASLGANVPATDTSGLAGSAVAGSVAAGATSLLTSSAAGFNSNSPLVQSAAPTLAPLAGAGITDGAHKWAFTFLTAGGETLPGPVSARSVGPVAAPTSAPALGAPYGTTGLGVGAYDYAVAFTTAAGETTPGPSASVTIALVSAGVPATPLMLHDGPNSNPTTRAVGETVGYRYTYVTAAGESLPCSGTLFVVTLGSSIGGGYSSAITVLLYNSTNPRVTSINLYTNVNGGPFYLTRTGISNNTALASQEFTDTSGDVFSGPTVPTSDGSLVAPGNVPITLPLGPDTTTGRVLYRRTGGGSFNRVAAIADRTTTAYTDTTPTASLGPPALAVSTAGVSNQVALSAIALGPVGVTGRRLYRTAAGGTQLKVLTTLANNSATTYTDSTPDASLGANAPTVDTSGGLAVIGGWAVIGNSQPIRYGGTSGNTLTGIPPSGPGAIQTTVIYGAQIVPAPMLTNVTGVGPMGSPRLVLDVKPGPYGGGLGAATWQYAVTFSSLAGESLPSPPVTVVTSAANGFGVLVGAGQLPVGATARNIYRTKADGSQLYFHSTTLAAFVDTTPSTSLVTPAPTVDTSGLAAIVEPLPKGTPISVWVQRDDLAAQAEQKAVDVANGIVPADGIYEAAPLVDERRNERSMIAACDAQLLQFARPLVTVTYACRDPKSKSGKTVSFDLNAYAATVIGDGAIAYWRFSESNGATFADHSGNGHTLTIPPLAAYPTGYVLNGAGGAGDSSLACRSGSGRFKIGGSITVGRATAIVTSENGDPCTHLDFAPPIPAGAAIPDGTPITQPPYTTLLYNVPGILSNDTGIGIAATMLSCDVPDVFLGAGTIELWVNPYDISAAKAYAALLVTAGDGFGLWLEDADITSPGTPGMKVSWYDGDLLADGVFSTAALAPDALYHIVLTRDRDGIGRLYINGALDSSFAGLAPLSMACVAGADYATAADLDAHLLDEMAIYPLALTAAQVADHYTARAWLSGAYTIQEVTITEIDIAPGLLPRFSCVASSTRFSLDDILRRLLTATDASPASI